LGKPIWMCEKNFQAWKGLTTSPCSGYLEEQKTKEKSRGNNCELSDLSDCCILFN